MQSIYSIPVPTSFEACTDSVITASFSLESDLQAQFAHDFFQNLLSLDLSLEQSFYAWQQIAELRAQMAKDKGADFAKHYWNTSSLRHSCMIPSLRSFGELQRLRLTSTTDHLTGTHNRRLFDAFLGKEVQRAARYGNDLSLGS